MILSRLPMLRVVPWAWSGQAVWAVDAVLAVAVLVLCPVSAWAVLGHALGMARQNGCSVQLRPGTT